MKRTLRLFRLLVVTAVSLLVAAPVALYILLSAPWAQSRLCAAAERELSALLGSRVDVGRVTIHPFNRVDISDIRLDDDHGNPCLDIKMLGARFELYHFLRTQRIVFDYALIDRPVVRLSRASAGAPLNIDGILSRLKGNPDKPASRFKFKIATLAVRDGSLTYDVLDSALPDSARFSPSHIALESLDLHASLRLISNDVVNIELDRLSFVERSGFTLTDLTGNISHDSDGLRVDGLTLELPNTTLAFNAAWTRADGQWSLGTDSVQPSVLYVPDLAAFAPVLADTYIGLDMEISAHGDSTSAMLPVMNMSTRDGALAIQLDGGVLDFGRSTERIWLNNLSLRSYAPRLVSHISKLMPSRPRVLDRLALLGKTDIEAQASVNGRADLAVNLSANTSVGRLGAKINSISADTFRTAAIRTEAKLMDLDAGSLLAQRKLGRVSARLTADGTLTRQAYTGGVTLDDATVQFNGRTCDGIYADASIKGNVMDGNIKVDDRDVQLELAWNTDVKKTGSSLNIEGELVRFDFATLWPGKRFAGYRLSSGIDIDLEGPDIDNMSGHIAMNNVDFRNDAGEGIRMKHFEIARDVLANPQTVELESDFINGSIQGTLRPSTLVGDLLNVVGGVFPALGLEQQNGRSANEHTCGNDFLFEFTVAEAEELSRFLSLPVQVINPIEISGHVNCAAHDISLALDAPYLQQADKIIDNTVLYAACDGLSGRASVYATTHMPTKKGPIAAILNIGASANRISTSADWTIERSIPLNGTLAFDTELGRGNDGNIAATIDFRPGTINFGDDVWDIRPSRIRWADGTVLVNNFILEAGEQRVAVNGELSPAVEPGLDVAINKVNLLPIFETLEIDKALIGGTATGLFKGQALMSKSPILTSERLHVDNIGYNYCTLGNADITAAWDNGTGNVLLDAVVTGFDGRKSHISGSIGPADETLDITFEADRVPVGFMQPYMSAFASAVDGYASGRAHLFGTFKYIDLEGDIFADSLSLKIDFTNTQYFCNDSIHMRPGEIIVPNVKILDVYGHTAALDGIVRHKFFKEPSFDFKVSDAREFLCYNVGPKQSPDWYGTIFGRGGAHIYGEPGVVYIDVNMSTTAGSTFTFVLSDMLEADEYSFITFRDRTPVEIHDSIVEVDLTPKAVLEYRQRMAAEMEEPPTDYNMDFRVDVTPEARVIIVMDPVGGDEIKANGSGNLRLTYGSANNDLRMFGTYTLDRGSYNFTLQDIIIKDFTIDEGSSISFHGDPYAAQLNIEAVYQVNANLSDLDESFLQDRELNRTNVPVQALMKVTGDMRQPDIDFDLRFPTLSSDVYRKVRSIVSTEDMMNRQIIYLLALNRFYTPDYMSTTKGNELFSVASSTISSQLSSMLGKLSDNWTIAPNLRSDRGDFSDVEVDVALSSRLLNNRLLFNGNFGYRDKSLNTNQFVGDFDIEYLLNRKGTWRLKAYNRYNDQNYYLRTADTTQGVGIMFKRDFDSLLGWLKPFRKKKESTEKMPADSVPNR